ncbi:response regulator [Pseudoroseicyclus aestuarii]|uniref:Winged helix family two component transcriptional regulator n=1 Tax=Pseudoroseicyclus aestuarii TaxID=1795041 RepID=A0A318SN94_9RHOB|nr:response regulator transcription factor [Pseudoroseicyclus aestuarii]PYE82283.1 winged helix family two component transcriptional regulator [Pseudoroseicyclus aestuarii]
MARILVIDDEPQIRRFLRIALEAEGHAVTEASTAREGAGRAATSAPDAVILDLGLPDRDGTEVLREIRGWSEVPVLVLSVRAEEDQKVAALDLGAQDYVTKPFGTRELLARLRALLRNKTAETETAARIEIGDLLLDAAQHSVRLGGQPLSLTPKEFDLLWLLASHAGRLVTQRMALQRVWGPAHAEDSQYLRVFIRQLRAKLGDSAADPVWIFTEPGIGYRFRES